MFHDEIRYVLFDELLREFIIDLHRLVETEQFLLRHIWSYLEEPTPEQEEQACLYYGKEMAEEIFREFHLSFLEHYDLAKRAIKELKLSKDTVIVTPVQNQQLKEREEQVLRGVSFMVEKYSDTILGNDQYALIREIAGKACPFLLTALQTIKAKT